MEKACDKVEKAFEGGKAFENVFEMVIKLLSKGEKLSSMEEEREPRQL